MKFLHTSDWHLTDGANFDNTANVVDFIIETAEREKVDGVLHAGDWTHHALPHRLMVPRERNYLTGSLFKHLEYGGPPWLTVYGNHDILGDLECLSLVPGVSVEHGARLVRWAGVDVLVVAFPQKRHWMAQQQNVGAIEGARQQLNATLSQALRGLVVGRRPGVPLVGLAHLNIAGSTLGGGEQMIGRELELTPQDLDEVGCDYWALGHIHERQPMTDRAWYCGTPAPQSFGDSNNNAVLLVEVEAGRTPRVDVIETPAVKFLTRTVAWDPVAPTWRDPAGLALEDLEALAAGPFHLRLVAQSREGEAPAYELLERFAAEVGASSLRLDKRVQFSQRVRGAEVAQARTTADKARAYWQTLEPTPPAEEQDAALEVLEELENA